MQDGCHSISPSLLVGYQKFLFSKLANSLYASTRELLLLSSNPGATCFYMECEAICVENEMKVHALGMFWWFRQFCMEFSWTRLLYVGKWNDGMYFYPFELTILFGIQLSYFFFLSTEVPVFMVVVCGRINIRFDGEDGIQTYFDVCSVETSVYIQHICSGIVDETNKIGLSNQIVNFIA